MWIKLCLLVVYICLLFLLSRLLETISWCDLGHSKVFSHQLLDPMRLSVAKLKCLLDHRGVRYDGILEKSELTSLVKASGPVNEEDVNSSCEEELTISETNFTSGSHFIEQVEDAKDSVWLVQVVTHTDQVGAVLNKRWRTIQRKAAYFGVRTGLLDCTLDIRYCHHKGWKHPVMLLALPSLFEKKANVIMYNYSGPSVESAVMRWIHQKLDERILRIRELSVLQKEQDLSSNSLQPEIKALLFTQAITAPLFFSALSVKFPGRVKFGLVNGDLIKRKKSFIGKISADRNKLRHLPVCIIYTAEGNYTYGFWPSERFSFSSMEIFLKFLYPCLNDIFIISFCITNVISWLEFFVCNCGLLKRLRKFVWCVLKYNLMVVLLWLPLIGLFQMPYLDRVPLLLLKLNRIFTTSDIGAVLRGDYIFFISNPVYVYLSFVAYLVLVTFLCKKYRQVEEDSDDWFNFRQMHTLTYASANNLFVPLRMNSSDLVGGFEVFGSHFSRHSLWLQPSIPLEYIQHLPTWRYTPQTMASRAAKNAVKVEYAMASANSGNARLTPETDSSLKHGEEHMSMKRDNDPPEPPAVRPLSDVVPLVPNSSEAAAAATGSSSFQASNVNPHSGGIGFSEFHDVEHGEHRVQKCSAISSCHNGGRHSPYAEPDGVPSLDASNPSLNPNQAHSSVTAQHQSQPLAATNQVQEMSTTLNQTRPDVLPTGFRKGFIESHQCVICLDDYAPLTMLCGLPCGHVFHESCIISWLNREKHFCPMCRWPSYKLMVSTNMCNT